MLNLRMVSPSAMNTGWTARPSIAVAELRFPPVQQGQAALGVADLVGQVVGPAAVGVDVADVLPQATRQEPAGDREVLVVPPGQPPAIAAALPQRGRLRRHGLRPVAFEIVGKHKHKGLGISTVRLSERYVAAKR